MKRFKKANLFALFFLLAFASLGLGQSSSSYKLERWTLGGGGGACTSTSYRVDLSIIGQGSAVGTSNSSYYSLQAGFFVQTPITISGNAGVSGAVMSYNDGGTKTTSADGGGNYTLTVSNNWSGTVTPSKSGYTFSPASRSYANLTSSQTNQDYTASLLVLNVDFAAGSGGTITGDMSQSVSYGGDCTEVTAVPDTGYRFVNWTGTGGFVTTTDNPLTVTGVTSSMTITANFSVNYITLVYPNGGESFRVGLPYEIKWTASGINFIKIELYKAGILKSVISPSFAAETEAYTWTVPAGQTLGIDYEIVITSLDTGSPGSDSCLEYFSIVSGTATVPAADFNQDGKSDILWRYYGTGGFNAVWMLGTNGALTKEVCRSTQLTEEIASKQKNLSDGPQSDVAWDMDNPADVGEAEEMRGDAEPPNSVSQAQAVLTDPRDDPQSVDLPANADLNWEMVAPGDFNYDGQPDILWRSKADGQNQVWLMDGVDQLSSSLLPQEANLNWKIVGTGDFNGDKKPDILWQNKADGQVRVWFMNGLVLTGTKALPQAPSLSWDIVGIGDFNLNKKVDILWRNRTTGQNMVWYMSGTSRVSSGNLLQVKNMNWEIVGTGDFDGNGKIDIVWRNKLDGRNQIWYMNKAVRTSYAFLSQVVGPNWKIRN